MFVSRNTISPFSFLITCSFLLLLACYFRCIAIPYKKKLGHQVALWYTYIAYLVHDSSQSHRAKAGIVPLIKSKSLSYTLLLIYSVSSNYSTQYRRQLLVSSNSNTYKVPTLSMCLCEADNRAMQTQPFGTNGVALATWL